ncbi:hypothetical protein VCRA2117O376_240017 [Vibrio crassostreae]|nr:hypothetical protein VCRA2117O376_240017 [Vibrio crassostreae]CAK2466295.1 hypothetical protein VCRA2117O377_240017 [Vibrio crassostreae]CAK2470295.1 hypothetical protein VCRA2116O374_250055 [Vibrio crassostreae]CDT54594.1 hypothetical protein VCRLGP8_490017 [Vibrio crassostreae]
MPKKSGFITNGCIQQNGTQFLTMKGVFKPSVRKLFVLKLDKS